MTSKMTVLVTNQGKGIVKQLEEQGFEPIALPLISIKPSHDVPDIQQVLAGLNSYQWLFFTSKNAVIVFFSFLKENKLPPSLQIAVVGEKTKQAVESYGYYVSFVPSVFDGDTFAREIVDVIQEEEKVLFPKGNLAREEITTSLQKHGIYVKDLIVYETSLPTDQQANLVSLLKAQKIHIIVFASSSAVENFVRLLAGTEWRQWIQSVQIACIGPITSQKAIDVGMKPSIVPSTYTFQALVDELGKQRREVE